MEKLLSEYKRLKSQLVGECGCEETIDQVGWNDHIMECMEKLLENVDEHIAQHIRLNHI